MFTGIVLMGYKKGFDDERRVSGRNTEQYMKSGRRLMRNQREILIKIYKKSILHDPSHQLHILTPGLDISPKSF